MLGEIEESLCHQYQREVHVASKEADQPQDGGVDNYVQIYLDHSRPGKPTRWDWREDPK